ncbi:hypothetical protein BHE74_00004564 [Ensete ventricosum]|nr:hypothetical protein BHE74_00004564 [Ensete ventricosum]
MPTPPPFLGMRIDVLQPVFLHGFSASCHLIFLLSLSLFWLCNRTRHKLESSKHGAESRSPLRHRLALFTCLVLGLFNLSLCLLDFFWYRDAWRWPRDRVAAARLDLALRAAAWLATSAYLVLRFRSAKRFPALLRVWWGLFLLMSSSFLAIDFLYLRQRAALPTRAWVLDIGSFPCALVLGCAAFLWNSREEQQSSDAREPLLNGGAHESCHDTTTGGASLFRNAGFLSTLTFYWMNPLLAAGHRKTLDLKDVPQLDERDSVIGVFPIFKSNLESCSGSSSSSASDGAVTTLKLVRALVLSTWKQILLTALYCLVYTVATYVGPYLIDYFVQYLNGSRKFANEGYRLVMVFVIAKILECLSQRHWFFRLQQVGIRVRASLVAMIYQKGLTLSSSSKQSRTSGEVINLMSVDADRVGLFSWYMHDLWMVPVQVALALLILYVNLGIASLAAFAATVVVMLANLPLGKMQEKYQEKIMECKDTRMKATSEILRNMRILKLQGWEMKFLSKIIKLRENETNWLRKYVYTSAMTTFVFWGAPTFVAVITFGACMLMGIPLESGKILSALATFRVLQEPIYNLPDTISMIIQTKVSLDRISSFLCLEELQSNAVHRLPRGSSEVAVEVMNGSFSWDPSSEVPTLKDLNFRVLQGMKVAVCGIVGSGKSSLLSCLLGEVPKISGTVGLCGTTAYVPQSPWIQSGKIQDNILFGKEMDHEKYDKVLKACSLQKDLEILPFGDQTVIGERGINLSGGQKQRIQIARALYHDADIFLLDDPFSAVDAHTGSHLFKFMELVGAHKDALAALASVELDIGTSDNNAEVGTSGTKCSARASNQENDTDAQNGKADEVSTQKGQLVQEEEREKGKVGFWVYWSYITMAYKGGLVPLILLAQILFQILQIGSNYWMAWAAPVSKDVEPPVSGSVLIYVYVALSVVSSFCILIRAILLVTAGYKTATLLFNKLHTCIFRAPMSFFDSTPSGRILNRVCDLQSSFDLS